MIDAPPTNPPDALARGQLGGIILCGGRSTRMGADKATLPIGEETMLQRVARLLRPTAARLAVVAAAEQELPTLDDDVLVVRDVEPDLGPLQGLALGLAVLAEHGLAAAYVTSCDAPFLRREWVRGLAGLLSQQWEIVAPTHEDRVQPLAAIYRTTLAARAAQLLQAGQRRPLSLMEHSRTRFVPADSLREFDPELGSLRNLNHPQDYQRALRDLKHSASLS